MLDCDSRRDEMLLKIKKERHITIEDLASFFNVNEQAIYRDLVFLEKSNKIIRTSKGAICDDCNNKKEVLNLDYRETVNYKNKIKIGKFASTLVNDGESLMIDGGSTTLLFSTNLLSKRKLMVITNTNTIGNLLKKDKKNRVILTGGQLLKNSLATTGSLTEKTIAQYRVNKAIIGVCSISTEKGFFTSLENEAKIKRAMIESAKEVIILADSSKTKRIEDNFVCSFSLNKKITLVTDSLILKEDKEKIEKQNVIVYTI